MHIEPGLVEGSKLLLSVGTATAALGYAAWQAWATRCSAGTMAVLRRSALATLLAFAFFEVLPHRPVGISELHLILGTTLMLVLGVGPTAVGLAGGLLLQGLLFEPQDLPQFGMNVTTLLVPLFATANLARRTIPDRQAYVDIGYRQALRLSLTYQGGIVAWVAIWALYGRGLGADNLHEIGIFAASYLLVVIVEPLVDLAVLSAAKAARRTSLPAWFDRRVYAPG